MKCIHVDVIKLQNQCREYGLYELVDLDAHSFLN